MINSLFVFIGHLNLINFSRDSAMKIISQK